MMTSPDAYRAMHKDDSIEDLIKNRDGLIEQIRELEQIVYSRDKTDEAWNINPGPDVRYQMDLEYLAELCKLLKEKYNNEIVWGDLEDMSDAEQHTEKQSSIRIRKIGITRLEVDAIVNAANEGLWEGGGVCGAIFKAAGSAELTKACNEIGGCKVGGAVITPGFKLPTKYIIHAVGPRWHGGEQNEPKLLYSAYKQSLLVAKDNDCHSIGFPLISAGIFGYPKDQAWRKAIQACRDFISANPDYPMEIIFAVLDDQILELGEQTLKELTKEK